MVTEDSSKIKHAWRRQKTTKCLTWFLTMQLRAISSAWENAPFVLDSERRHNILETSTDSLNNSRNNVCTRYSFEVLCGFSVICNFSFSTVCKLHNTVSIFRKLQRPATSMKAFLLDVFLKFQLISVFFLTFPHKRCFLKLLTNFRTKMRKKRVAANQN